METLRVLDAVYARSSQQIASAVEILLAHAELTLQDADVVVAALALIELVRFFFRKKRNSIALASRTGCRCKSA